MGRHIARLVPHDFFSKQRLMGRDVRAGAVCGPRARTGGDTSRLDRYVGAVAAFHPSSLGWTDQTRHRHDRLGH